jgi:hypothetical protein
MTRNYKTSQYKKIKEAMNIQRNIEVEETHEKTDEINIEEIRDELETETDENIKEKKLRYCEIYEKLDSLDLSTSQIKWPKSFSRHKFIEIANEFHCNNCDLTRKHIIMNTKKFLLELLTGNRKCEKCEDVKDLYTEFRISNSPYIGRILQKCIKCELEEYTAYKIKTDIPISSDKNKKYCFYCVNEKPLNAFDKGKNGCKECRLHNSACGRYKKILDKIGYSII